MTPAIRIENLGKRYIVNHESRGSRGGYKTLRESLTDMAAAPFRRLRGEKAATSEEFWALKDVSFEVQPGEVVGIIGRNGAGKSTLLKILSQITKPTKGRIELNGRVGSLLEVGTGFHPELTGRENIYLNGSILGMSKGEIDRKFDEIVDFAEIEQFLDTPVKRYSSGMYVKLAFAVAAHLEPEILIIDEVLAVGDAAFQKKCFAKVSDVAKCGRTVLLVSHNTAAITHLCTHSVVIASGRTQFTGAPEEGVKLYLESGRFNRGAGDLINASRPTWATPVLKRVNMVNDDTIVLGDSITFDVEYEVTGNVPLKQPVLGVVLNHTSKGTVGGVNNRMVPARIEGVGHSAGRFRCTLLAPPLLQATYSVDLWIGDGSVDIDMVSDAFSFTIDNKDIYRSGVTPNPAIGVVYFNASWEHRSVA